jgi:hypothetical protein
MIMAYGSLRHKYHREHGKYDRLDHTHKELEKKENGLCKYRHQTTNYEEKYGTCEDISE